MNKNQANEVPQSASTISGVSPNTLDRFTNKEPGRGKYALLKLRLIPISKNEIREKVVTALGNPDAIDFGDTAESDFFVIRLKDKYAAPALAAYAQEAQKDGNFDLASSVNFLVSAAFLHEKKERPS